MMRLVDRSPVLDLKGMVAKVVGLPGFMATRPKWMVPPRERSMVGLRRSSSPIETPPVVTMISTERMAVRREASRVSGLWILQQIFGLVAVCIAGKGGEENEEKWESYLSFVIPKSTTS